MSRGRVRPSGTILCEVRAGGAWMAVVAAAVAVAVTAAVAVAAGLRVGMARASCPLNGTLQKAVLVMSSMGGSSFTPAEVRSDWG